MPHTGDSCASRAVTPTSGVSKRTKPGQMTWFCVAALSFSWQSELLRKEGFTVGAFIQGVDVFQGLGGLNIKIGLTEHLQRVVVDEGALTLGHPNKSSVGE